METFEWLKPQPMWGEIDLGDAAAARGPVIARFDTDAFMERFLDAMGGEALSKLSFTAAGERLFLPFHERYHLVLASLVCNRLGFPDRALDPEKGESVGFVLRRVAGAKEWAWIPGSGWVGLDDKEALGSADGGQEEVLPLVRSRAGKRSIWHGFVPLAAGADDSGSGSKFGTTPGQDRHVLRCVYRRPRCRITPTILSERSHEFEISTFLDPVAPQRPVEIGLDLQETAQAMKRTVSFKLGALTRGVVGDVASDLPEDFPSLSGSGVNCDQPSLSIPWITLVAFILLMIVTAILFPILIALKFLLGGSLPCVAPSGGAEEA